MTEVSVEINAYGAILIAGLPQRPTEVEAQSTMRQLSKLLNTSLSAFKLSGAWFIVDGDGKTLAGDQARGQRRRSSFTAALADATGRAVSQTVPFN